MPVTNRHTRVEKSFYNQHGHNKLMRSFYNYLYVHDSRSGLRCFAALSMTDTSTLFAGHAERSEAESKHPRPRNVHWMTVV